MKIWNLKSTNYRLLRDFSPEAVSNALSFIWKKRLSGFGFTEQEIKMAILPQEGGYYRTLTPIEKEYATLLELPHAKETKLHQIQRFLDSRCSYKRKADRDGCKIVGSHH
ncbi:MAG: hypothetical protein R3E93_16765 [Thiothrix sp.]